MITMRELIRRRVWSYTKKGTVQCPVSEVAESADSVFAELRRDGEFECWAPKFTNSKFHSIEVKFNISRSTMR